MLLGQCLAHRGLLAFYKKWAQCYTIRRRSWKNQDWFVVLPMIDDIDRNIVMDAFADYELVFHSVQEIAVKKKCNLKDAFAIFSVRFNRLSRQMPLSYYETHKLGDYNALEPTPSQGISSDDIFTNSGEIAGPPYYFYSYINTQGALDQYNQFIEEHGLPMWITVK